jgi:hypothetical protein
VPDLLDRAADLRQDAFLDRQTVFLEIANHGTRDDAVEPGYRAGVVREVLASQFRYLAVAQ